MGRAERQRVRAGVFPGWMGRVVSFAIAVCATWHVPAVTLADRGGGDDPGGGIEEPEIPEDPISPIGGTWVLAWAAVQQNGSELYNGPYHAVLETPGSPGTYYGDAVMHLLPVSGAILKRTTTAAGETITISVSTPFVTGNNEIGVDVQTASGGPQRLWLISSNSGLDQLVAWRFEKDLEDSLGTRPQVTLVRLFDGSGGAGVVADPSDEGDAVIEGFADLDDGVFDTDDEDGEALFLEVFELDPSGVSAPGWLGPQTLIGSAPVIGVGGGGGESGGVAILNWVAVFGDAETLAGPEFRYGVLLVAGLGCAGFVFQEFRRL